MNRNIMQQALTVLRGSFPEIQTANIYETPFIVEVACAAPFELQVAVTNADYRDLEGGVRSGNFLMSIGILQSFKLDSVTRYANYLADANKSIWVIRDQIDTLLDGSFLPVDGTNLLTRPLRLVEESCRMGARITGTLIKEMKFLGGLNALRL